MRRAVTHQRIALVASAFPKLSETFIVNQFSHLQQRGWDIHIVCARSEPTEWANFPTLPNQPDLKRRVHPSWPHRSRLLAALLLPIALLRCLVRSPVATFRYLKNGWRVMGLKTLRRLYLDAELIVLDPALIHFEFGPLAVERSYIKDWLGCRTIASFRGYDLNYVGLDQPNYYTQVWRKMDALHLLGEDLWQRAQRRGCPSNKTHFLIPPAVDLNTYAPTFFPQANSQPVEEPGEIQPVNLLSVGRLEWKKGYEYGLQAIRMLLDAGIDCRYTLIGSGDFLEAVAYAIHELDLEEVVTLAGRLSPAEVRRCLDQADILLHPAVSEGFCNAVVEAQAMGVPVVCTDADGLRENICDGVTGFVVPRRDPRALANRLAELALSPQLRHEMGHAGRRRAEALFSLDGQISGFEDLYRSLLAPKTAQKSTP